MSEYIVDLPDSGAADEAVKRFGVDDSRLYGYQLTGEIVRCRDCRYRVISNGYFECGSEQWEGYAGLRCEVKPDGFCSWGDRKVS